MCVKSYYAVYIQGDSINTERPEAEEAYVLNWEAADIVIPWPEGKTAKQAILVWAKKMIYEASK